jgi:ribonuclease PH
MPMTSSLRPSARRPEEMRRVTLEPGVLKHAEGSCLVKFGDTHVLVTASIENQPPPFLRGSGKGWVTAEYGMLPRATQDRTRREAAAGKQTGRTQEIQRLIGRSLRAVTALELLGERQIIIDCDVLQADGGTRTASITGGFVALHRAISFMVGTGLIAKHAIKEHVAAVSCGIHRGVPVLDLDYAEDSAAATDANFVITGSGGLVEIQGTAEGVPFSEAELSALLALAKKGAAELILLQKEALKL